MRSTVTGFLLLTLSVTYNLQAQQPVSDSIALQQLEEVVVTGQPEPQSIRKSVFNVKVITRKDIDRQAANNLADLMNFYLNININQDPGEGRSTLSMFGLDQQYLKVMVDNVPIVGDSGLGNNIDLTQINLDDIEQIEIIEGSMGVTHGANAVSGIINIITKKSSKTDWEIKASVQEESVGSEYSASDKGRHIQSLKVSHNLSDNWFISIGGNRNDFAGLQGDRGGKNYVLNPVDPAIKRGYSWLPKEQYVGNALVSYQKNRTRVFYKFDYFNENIDFYNPIVSSTPNYPFWDILYGEDRRYKTERLYHHLNSSGLLYKDMTYNISASYQKQTRDFEDFDYFIEEREEANNQRLTYQSTEVIYSTGSISNILNNKKYNLQLGYELVNEKGFASEKTGIFRDETNNFEDKRAVFNNYDLYTAAELAFTERFSGRAGLRYSAQSKFDDQYAASVGLRYLFNKGVELRSSLGKSYRTPNFEELYTYLVDSNHDVRGNQDLTPENSTSIDLNLKKATNFSSGLKMSNNIMITYLDVQDRIGMVQINFQPLQYKYINIDNYRVWNFSTGHEFNFNNFSLKAGAAVIGTSQNVSNGAIRSDDSYLWGLQLNGNLNYSVPKWNTEFSVYYKLNGRQQQIVQTEDADGNQIFGIAKISSFSWLNASVRKTFFKNRFDVSLGARNLLDVTNVRSSIAQGGNLGHGGGSNDIASAYGRSYFVKLVYNINL
jgi:outer membrane receptor for ferrienterochelin and colicins